ncbi:hypothetical protein KXD96_03680 [Mycobacterium sp. SMC-2]|uniref:hypothetical protein n=1 Tax=Mycobacterium sp. SMC-2 TaxID=2857058 RepID=UPI0021B4364C|nr:hypothetical protein [Mycobacterium sp. SMC-2]UXA07264.1 hypothetical protein KXD96_03680 [Mycobacterium sp. SMC-2]
MCHNFERVGVRTAPDRVQEMLAGAPLAADEAMDIHFALIALKFERETRAARYKRLKRQGTRSLMFAGLILVVLNFLMCMAYGLLNLADQGAPL